MTSKFADSEKYLLDEFGTQVEINNIYLLKAGFLRLEFKDDFGSDFFSKKDGDKVKTFVDQLYKSLLNSPNVMEISPEKNVLLPDEKSDSNTPIFFTPWATTEIDFVSFSQYLKLRVVLPKKKRDELFQPFLPEAWNPEQFTLYFNGAIFMALAPVDSFPAYTEMGQVAREFLVDTLGSTDIWEHNDGFGPTPIHPDFYFVIAQTDSQENLALQPSILLSKENDVIVILPEKSSIDEFMDYFLHNTQTAFEDFYKCIVIRSNLFVATEITENENQQLRALMSKYFSQSWFSRLFGNVTGNIRKVLGEMHMTLFEISTLEMQLSKMETTVIASIQKSPFLTPVIDYFQEHSRSEQFFDRNAQLTAMNFAAEEASNNSINRSTLVAAFIGALVGGLITFIIQILVK